MMKRRFLLAICLGLTLLLCGPLAGAASVLFIGNSFTYFNDGLDRTLTELAPGTVTAKVVAGGYTLEQHWNNGATQSKLHERRWDFVVLQEQSQTPVIDTRKYYEYAAKFDAEIRRNGGRTVLLMTWERPDSVQYGVTTSGLAAAVNGLGTQLGVAVAPAGLAFARSLRERAGLALYVNDGHPTPAGSYLAACVLFKTIFERSPVGLSYAPRGVDAAARDHLQRIATLTTR